MDLATICQVNKYLLEERIASFLNQDSELSIEYKTQLLKLIFSSGKRLRPIFTVLGSYYGTDQSQDVYSLAAIYELIHTASLIHDDIVDQADTRRGKETLHVHNGVYNSLILGNYLVALSCEYISRYNFEDIYYDSVHLTSLCSSEIDQQKLLYHFDITFDEYIEKTKNKTALLIAASLLGGAKLAKADRQTLGILYEYAINLGISFQIIDDILDFTQEKELLGKPNGSDLVHGNITLPVIFALQDKKIRNDIKNLTKMSSIEDFNHCINYISKSKAIEKSIQVSSKYLARAKKTIKKLNHPKKQMLIDILDNLQLRTY